MTKIKTIYRWVGGAILVIALACITMPFGMGYPFLYIMYSFDPSTRIPEPARMEKILNTHPSDIYDLEQRLSKYVIVDPVPRATEPGFQDYQKQMEEDTAEHIADGKLKSALYHWYHGKVQMDAVKYIVLYRTKSAWDRAKADMGGHMGATNYYVLLDRNFRILGWLKEEV